MHASGRLWVLRLAAAAMLLLVVARAALFTTYRVAGASMREALQDGDRIVVASHPWLVQPVLAGDTVILRVDDEVLVKRVMACPGDCIAMDRGHVLRNGAPVVEAIPAPLEGSDSFPEYHLRGDEYFVLGDNRRVSIDSRDFGPVHGWQVMGKVFLRMHGSEVSTVAALERGRR
ncbi:MAG TPA: signal peptidase I [Planctomycetota bacterium]|jgi:signal peptidase I|nr:signal peptidase I [Planctomycetota bacterium]